MPIIPQQPLPEVKRYPSYAETARAFSRMGIKAQKRILEGMSGKGNFDRDDFHWLTLFESIDGFFKSGTGGVNITLDSDGRGVELVNNATLSDEQRLYKNLGAFAPTKLTWDKDRKIKFKVKLEEETAQTAWFVTGSVSVNTARHFGFVVATNGVLYGTVANGTSETNAAYGSIGIGQVLLEARYIARDSVEFFKDGAKLGTITTNLPTGVTDSQFLSWIATITLENVAKTIQVGFWDFWQEK